jgi:hypothetical protein
VPLLAIVGVNTPDPRQVSHVSAHPLDDSLPLPWQLEQVTVPVPLHVGHSAIAGATFKAEKRRSASDENISSLFFTSFHLPQIFVDTDFFVQYYSHFFILRVERGH